MKRVLRKQLKEDEFVTTFNKVVDFIKKHTKTIIAGVALILFALIVLVGVKFIKSQAEKKESVLLTEILQLSSDLEGSPENVKALESLGGKGKFSRLAYIHLATHWVGKNELDKAMAVIEKMPKNKKDLFYYQAQDLMAQIHIKNGNFDRAIEIYNTIEEENPGEYSLDVVLFHRAEAHEGKGEKEKALELYRRIKNDFPGTYYGLDASGKVEELERKK